MKVLKEHKCFHGMVRFNEHDSQITRTKMAFSTFVPDGKLNGCLIWLSGLTCTDENFMAKAGAQKSLAEAGLMVVCPDTSPRGLHLPQEHEASDFGSGAGFYVNATTPGYRDHYRMYDYVAQELYELIEQRFQMKDRISIFGHSMGGHGALILGLREKAKFKSVSAFAPIVNPMKSPWGRKALKGYLGDDESNWKKYDSCELLGAGHFREDEILIDQGTLDPFLAERLQTESLIAAAKKSKQKFNVRFQEGYDHSYYFIATFVADHIRFHRECIAP